MKKTRIHYMGLLGIVSLLSYSAAVIFSPLAYPGYDWMSQAVSDLSAANAPSLRLWSQLSSLYGICGLVSIMMAGAILSGTVPKEYFGITERFSVFAATGFNAVLGMYLWKNNTIALDEVKNIDNV